jgi:hypothetical protein
MVKKVILNLFQDPMPWKTIPKGARHDPVMDYKVILFSIWNGQNTLLNSLCSFLLDFLLTKSGAICFNNLLFVSYNLLCLFTVLKGCIYV